MSEVNGFFILKVSEILSYCWPFLGLILKIGSLFLHYNFVVRVFVLIPNDAKNGICAACSYSVEQVPGGTSFTGFVVSYQ